MIDENNQPSAQAGDDEDAFWQEFARSDAEKAQAAPVSDDARADDDADLDADGDELPAQDTDTDPEPKPETEPPADKVASSDPKQEASTDIWATAPPEAKAAYDKLHNDLLRERNRTSALQKKYESRPMPAQAQASAEDELKSLKARREKLQDEYPEIAESFTPIIDHLEKQVASLSDALTETRTHQRNEVLEREYKTLKAEHDDYDRIVDPNGEHAEKLVAWINDPSTPRWVYEAAQRNWQAVVDGSEVARLMTAYKQHAGLGEKPAEPAQQGQNHNPVADRRQRQSKALMTPQTRTTGATVNGPPPDDASEDEHWEYFRRMDEQKSARR